MIGSGSFGIGRGISIELIILVQRHTCSSMEITQFLMKIKALGHDHIFSSRFSVRQQVGD